MPDRERVRDDAYASGVLALIEQLGGPTLEPSLLDDVAAPAPVPVATSFAVRDFRRRSTPTGAVPPTPG